MYSLQEQDAADPYIELLDISRTKTSLLVQLRRFQHRLSTSCLFLEHYAQDINGWRYIQYGL